MASNGDLLLLPEIWREILARLPVKSILRCRSVCKLWYSLISCPNFISNYSIRNLNKSGNRLLLQLYNIRDAKVWSYSSHDESFMESHEHDYFPERFCGLEVRIVGSCNGLICLSKHDPACYRKDGDYVSVVTFLIWNPAIRKIFELPSRTFCRTTQYASYYGFGFDSKIGDYKVMCTVGNVSEIFDLGKGVWRGIRPLLHPWNVRHPTPDCYLHEAVHWSGYRHVKSSDMILLSFNMSDECFREIRMPNFAEFIDNGEGYIRTKSVTTGGLIYVIVWKVGQHDLVDMLESCSVWAMKEYGVTESWIKVSNIDLRSAQVFPSTRLSPHKFHVWENSEVLIVRSHQVDNDGCFGHKQDLVLYNTGSREFKRLFSITKCISHLCFYQESLFLMC